MTGAAPMAFNARSPCDHRIEKSALPHFAPGRSELDWLRQGEWEPPFATISTISTRCEELRSAAIEVGGR